MTVQELRLALAAHPGHWNVVVIEQGHVALITHAHTEEGAPVVVLYVEEPPDARREN
jgi:pantothenate synthetase